jgi:ribose 5-phosphate isomerase A
MQAPDIKKLVAEKAVEFVQNEMTVGLGTGSTAYWAIEKLGERVAAGLNIKAVASSISSEEHARKLGIPIIPFSELEHIDVSIDGADEVDSYHNLIKGGGGALLREKILAYNSKKFIVVVDESKLVERLGSFPLPVEIVSFAAELILRQIQALGCEPVIRKKDGKNFITDNGNLVADCHFRRIDFPLTLNNQLHHIPGVVETGLFLNTMVATVLVGYGNGTVLMHQSGPAI